MWNEYRRNKFIKDTKYNFSVLMIAILIIFTVGFTICSMMWLFSHNYIVFGVLVSTFFVFILSAIFAYFE